MQRLTDLYRQLYGTAPTTITPITGSGSPRQYYRMTGEDHSVIGTIGTSHEENRAFIGITRHFESTGLPVPHILGVSPDGMAYIQSDLGNSSLYDALSNGRKGGNYSAEEKELLHKAITMLPRFQILGARELDTSLCYPAPTMDSMSIMFDLNYFKYCFLKLRPEIEFNEIMLQHDMEHLCADIADLASAAVKEPTLMLRDFQARNIMIDNDGALALIDYQGCRLGPVEYDLASFLWQASAHYSPELREELIDSYIDATDKLVNGQCCLRSKSESIIQGLNGLRHRLRLMVFFRLLQVLGAYGYRGLHQRKPHFLNSIPAALANLRDLLASGVAEPYPYLYQILQKLTEPAPTASIVNGELTVTITSFSYKRGLPEDPSGNGGGYVFDCRSTHNPGRYAEYKNLTGLDPEVIRFLEDDGEILTFLSHIYPLAEHHVERFVSRGFTSLMISFGCTGGQHRSVYCAEHLAEHLRKRYPDIRIHLIHREQGIDKII